MATKKKTTTEEIMDEVAAKLGHNHGPDIPDYSDLRSILDDLSDSATEISEATGRHRSGIKSIIEDRHWNKAGFAIIRKLDALSDSSLADVLFTLIPLMDLMLANGWRQLMDDMVAKMEDDDESPESDEDESPEE